MSLETRVTALRGAFKSHQMHNQHKVIEVKTDYSTLENELLIMVEQFMDDDYMNQIYDIFNYFLENLNNNNLIDIDLRYNTIKYLQNMNEYKRELIYGMDNIAMFVETVRNIEKETNYLFASSSFSNAILDITDSYLKVSELYREIAKDKLSLKL